MPTSAAISAVGSLASSAIGAFGANSAAKTQAGYGQQALTSLQGYLSPLLSQGAGIVGSVLPTLTSLLTPGANQTATLNNLPGFKFAQDWGQTAVKNLATTTGLGGNALTAGANFATGVAQQGFGGLVGMLQNLLGTGTGLESSAANALAGGTSSALQGIGSAKAAGTLGSANALAGGLGSVGSSLGTYSLLSKLLKNNDQSQPEGGGPSIYGSVFGQGGFQLPSQPITPDLSSGLY